MNKRTFWILLVALTLVATAIATWWPRSAEYYLSRGENRLLEADAGGGGWDVDGALVDFNRAIRLNPNLAIAYHSRAEVRAAKGQSTEAMSDYDRAIKLSPNDARTYRSRADFWAYSRGDLAKALADYNRAVEVAPKDFLLYSARSRLQKELGDFSGMLADLAKESELCPPASSDQVQAKRNLRAMGNDSTRVLQRQLANYNHALAQNPDFALGYFNRGVLKHLNNDLEGALSDFRRCAGFPDPRLQDYAAIHVWLVRAQKGEQPEANQELSAYVHSHGGQNSGGWEMTIANFLLNHSSETEFAAVIGTSDAEWKRSQFWFYSAVKQLLAGDKEKATALLYRSRTTETRPYVVALSSQIQLSNLDP